MGRYRLALLGLMLVILIYFVAMWNSPSYEAYMNGFWVAESDRFCAKSEISSMLLFIGEPAVGWLSTVRVCHLVIMDNLCNQTFTMRYRSQPTWPKIGKYTIQATVEFEEEDIWPEQVRVVVDITTGTLTVTSSDVIYAKVRKQHELN